jgi:hypothetical protein
VPEASAPAAASGNGFRLIKPPGRLPSVPGKECTSSKAGGRLSFEDMSLNHATASSNNVCEQDWTVLPQVSWSIASTATS